MDLEDKYVQSLCLHPPSSTACLPLTVWAPPVPCCSLLLWQLVSAVEQQSCYLRKSHPSQSEIADYY